MNDREFLMWIHERLHDFHGEKETMDFMHKLRAIIKATDPGKSTPNMGTKNSLDELKRELDL